MSVVGTFNGLVCLCDHGHNHRGQPFVIDGRSLHIPPLPSPSTTGRGRCYYNGSWHESYSFTYLPATGRYKVVHVPCQVNRSLYDNCT